MFLNKKCKLKFKNNLKWCLDKRKWLWNFIKKNPSALASLRGTVYEDKIINLIKTKAKPNKKEISKDDAEKILKESQKNDHDHDHVNSDEKKTTARSKTTVKTKDKTVTKKNLLLKKKKLAKSNHKLYKLRESTYDIKISRTYE